MSTANTSVCFNETQKWILKFCTSYYCCIIEVLSSVGRYWSFSYSGIQYYQGRDRLHRVESLIYTWRNGCLWVFTCMWLDVVCYGKRLRCSNMLSVFIAILWKFGTWPHVTNTSSFWIPSLYCLFIFLLCFFNETNRHTWGLGKITERYIVKNPYEKVGAGYISE